jgi:hypothetical protein
MRMVSMVGQTKVCPCHELWADRLNRALTKFFGVCVNQDK